MRRLLLRIRDYHGKYLQKVSVVTLSSTQLQKEEKKGKLNFKSVGTQHFLFLLKQKRILDSLYRSLTAWGSVKSGSWCRVSEQMIAITLRVEMETNTNPE